MRKDERNADDKNLRNKGKEARKMGLQKRRRKKKMVD